MPGKYILFFLLTLLSLSMNQTKKLLFFLIISLYSLSSSAQVVDTIINTGVYKSYFSYSVKEPLYVTYSLYKGGGECSRKGLTFDECGINTATDADYAHSGFDKGHLANAEDFAYDCDKDKITFCYYNAMPQTVKLNRGIWKSWEEKIRTLSQKKHLFIVAGGIYSTKTIGPNHIGVPDYCYKIVLNGTGKKVLYCLLFPNDDSRTVRELPVEELKGMLGYALVP
jgi:endonuclease G